MALSAPLKALALVLFLGGIAGATYAVNSYVGDTVESSLVSVSAAHAKLNATPGHDVTYVLSVNNRDVASRDVFVEVNGYVTGKSDVTTVRGNSTAAVFVTVHVSDDAVAGERPLDVRVVSGTRTVRERLGLLQLDIRPQAPGLAIGDTGEAVYVGRLSATGRVFNTNDADLLNVNFPKTDSYRFSQGLLPLTTFPRPNVVLGLAEGMLGMQPGESRTVSFGFAKGYGPATDEQVEPRDEVVERERTLVNDAQSVTRAEFDAYIDESGQNVPGGYKVGSIFTLEQSGNNLPYQVVNFTNESVDYKFAPKVGDAYTLFGFWPNASVVQSITESDVTFRTTPTTAVGQAFTMRASWPEMSALQSMNETSIVVRHSPPVGFTYTTLTQLGQPREATIKEVNEQRIVVALPATNPLAGKDLTFDVTLTTLTKRPTS